jgi:hypothetical protein
MIGILDFFLGQVTHDSILYFYQRCNIVYLQIYFGFLNFYQMILLLITENLKPLPVILNEAGLHFFIYDKPKNI